MIKFVLDHTKMRRRENLRGDPFALVSDCEWEYVFVNRSMFTLLNLYTAWFVCVSERLCVGCCQATI